MIYLEFESGDEDSCLKLKFKRTLEAYDFLHELCTLYNLELIGTEESSNCTWYCYKDGTEAKIYQIF